MGYLIEIVLIKKYNNNNKIMNILNYFRLLSKTLLTLSKILMVIVSFYYLLNYNIYSYTVNVPQSVRSYFPSINNVLTIIESFGMIIVIIPLTFIILSFVYLTKFWLQLLANFFSIAGNLFSLGHLISKGLLEEYFRTFLLTIYNAPSLETKISLFSDFFNTNINTYCSSVKNIKEFQTYVKTLKSLSQIDIMSFSAEIAERLYLSYIPTQI